MRTVLSGKLCSLGWHEGCNLINASTQDRGESARKMMKTFFQKENHHDQSF